MILKRLFFVLLIILAQGGVVTNPVAVGAPAGSLSVSSASNPNSDFTLMDHDGRQFNLSQLRGKVVLLYFGYTSCTEACPTMLIKVSSALKILGQSREKVAVLLITLDPERDTKEKLKKYLQYFKVNGLGLTGRKEEIDKVVEQYKARYEVEKSDSALGYHISHTTDLYLIDQSGKLQHRFKHDDHAQTVASGLKRLLE